MRSKRGPYFLRVAASIAILFVLGRLVGWNELGSRLSGARGEWIAAMIAVALLALMANAMLLRMLLRRVGLEVRLIRVLLANCLGTLYTLLLPSDVLAGVAKWADLSAATGDKARVLPALVLAKVAQALPPLVVGSIALAVRNPFASDDPPRVAAVGATLLVAGTGVALSERLGPHVDRWGERAVCALPARVQARARSALSAATGFRALTFADKLQVLLLSGLAFGFGVAAMKCATIAASVSVSWIVLLWVAMILFISRLIPITLSNLGVREGILVGVFGLYGVESAAALLVGLIMFLNTIAQALVGAAYQVSIVSGWAKWRRT